MRFIKFLAESAMYIIVIYFALLSLATAKAGEFVEVYSEGSVSLVQVSDDFSPLKVSTLKLISEGGQTLMLTQKVNGLEFQTSRLSGCDRRYSLPRAGEVLLLFGESSAVYTLEGNSFDKCYVKGFVKGFDISTLLKESDKVRVKVTVLDQATFFEVPLKGVETVLLQSPDFGRILTTESVRDVVVEEHLKRKRECYKKVLKNINKSAISFVDLDESDFKRYNQSLFTSGCTFTGAANE